MADGRALTRALLDLAAVLQGGQPDDEQRQKIEAKAAQCDLLDGDSVPDWLLQLFERVRERRTTADWVPFKLRGLDDSDALDFVRELDEVLPVEFENNEETWLLRFPDVGLEAAISFEGPSYKVSQLGATWS
jgi:hypothetical protein